MGDQHAAAKAFIDRWKASGGAERSNYQLFLMELCGLLGVTAPDPAREENAFNDYVFERSITFRHPDGSTSAGFIDLYKRNSFVLEAKQSSKQRGQVPDAEQLRFIDQERGGLKAGTARRGTRAWDTAMLNARRRAEDYAKALPREHGWPPLLIIADVGHCIELYADFSAQGKNYAQFPDRATFRTHLADLADPAVRERLRKAWTEPLSLDPARIAAEVTREIAERLARVAKALEDRGHHPKTVAEFLMRCLFTMFAEDVGLLPKDSFRSLLEEVAAEPDKFKPLVESLWQAMNRGEFSAAIREQVRRFNGGLFAHPEAIALEADQIHELAIAAKRDWHNVEPAIFGTLLERALDKRERQQLGAHYTPRAYVERLVVPTIIEPLAVDWRDAQAVAQALMAQGKATEARKAVRGFHTKLCRTRVLDPACGTGNFLYVAMELMKRLEGEVLEFLAAIGEVQYPLETVDPHQFLGLELNERAVAIADLVLWIGFIKWQLRTRGTQAVHDPVLKKFDNVRHQDAVLAYERQELLRDEQGHPITRWDGATMKLHPVTGEEIPDEGARIELTRYVAPRRPPWPEAEFIVGNPPFIGGKDIRARLGDGYAEALWSINRGVPNAADFVMYWWDRAADLLTRKGTPLRLFGLITTNSVAQTFSRRVIERHLKARKPVSLLLAIPDHPWVKGGGRAAVRIAMTVGVAGSEEGMLRESVAESDLDTDAPKVELSERRGIIRADLTIGPDVVSAVPLGANKGISSPGVKLHGAGFIVTPAVAHGLGLGSRLGLEKYILPYRNGRDLTGHPRGVMVIDLFGLSEAEVQERFAEVYQYVLLKVRPDRAAGAGRTADSDQYARQWWLFGKPRPELRRALTGCTRYIATVETAKHRTFQFLPVTVRADNMLICVASADAFHLAILSSRTHVAWTLAKGGTLEDRPRYTKSGCFDPFPFPECADAAKVRLRDLGERLDAHRKARQAAHPELTLTAMYNVLEKLRRGDALDESERLIHGRGLISVLKQIHDDIDAAVAEAYGWPADLADEEILERLVALNRERAAEERRGIVHWLRPEYQVPRFGAAAAAEQIEADLGEAEAIATAPTWPAALPAQIRLVRAALSESTAPLSPEDVAARFKGGRKRAAKVGELLETLAALGQAQVDGGRYFVPRG